MNEDSSRVAGSRNVSRARARARAVRSAVARRRRRAVALSACAAALVGLPVAWMIAEPASVVAAAAAGQISDLADLLDQRSPGARTQAELTKHARALAKVRSRPKVVVPDQPPSPHVADPPAELATILETPPAPVGLVTPDLQSPLAPPPGIGAILASLPGDQAFTPPAEGGRPKTHPTAEPQEQVPLPSAVPEPGTWAMMLMGFGLIAWRIRRRRPSAGKLTRASL